MGMSETKLGAVLNKEMPISRHLPYTCHVDPYTLVTENDDYLQVIKLQGMSFETADHDLLNLRHEQRNNLLRNISKGQISLWTNIIRQKHNRYPKGSFSNEFPKQLDWKYRKNINETNLYKNDLYVVVIYRDISDLKVVTNVRKAKRKVSKNEGHKSKKIIKELTDTVNAVVSSLDYYEPRRLRTYEYNGYIYSEVLEYLGRLLNHDFQRYPISRHDIKHTLATTRISFGTEAGEIRMVKGCKYFGALGIKEYCSETAPGMLDRLLTLPMEFVLTQSFTFSNKQKSIESIRLQRDRLISAGDLSQSQIEELDDALDDLVSNRIVAGDHHLTLVPLADSVAELEDNLSEARSRLSEEGLVIAREDAALEAAFWSQFPANFSYRPRPSMITSRNFSGFSPFHNFPAGHIESNHWGPALALFKTTSNTPYYFSFHRFEKGTPPGNGAIVGPTGTGKTVVMGFMLTMAEKFGGRRIFFDKDQGAAVMVKAQDGIYSVIKKGVSTGFNPLQMEPNASNIEFLNKLLKRIAEMAGGPISSSEERQISDAIQGVMRLPVEHRTLFNMLPFMDMTKEDSVAHRLARWAGDGDRAWVFDNEQDRLNLSSNVLGFDMTEVLDDDDLRTPISLYIIHRIKSLIDGSPIIITFDEGWKYARDPLLGPQLEDFYRTIRKQNGVIIFGTNDASDISKAEVGKVILQQSQWQMYFPNPKAKRGDYIDAMDLTEKEYEIVRTLPEKSRCFLLKRGLNSVVIQLNLVDMENELAVLSGTSETVNLLDVIINEVGEKSKDWLPIFHERRKAI